MGVLSRFEKGIERVVNGAFAKAFRSEVQPVELAGALRREADNRAAVVSRGRTLTANSYTVELSDTDLERLSDIQAELSADLRQVVGEHAASQGYSFVGPVAVDFTNASDLDTGMYRVRSTTQRPDGSPAAQPQSRGGYDPQSRANPVVAESGGISSSRQAPQVSHVSPAAQRAEAPENLYASPPNMGVPRGQGRGRAARTRHVVEVNGVRHDLSEGTTTFGRSANSADIVLDDPGISRRHFEISVSGPHATATDLGSTNGTLLHGRRITTVNLSDGAVLTAGSSTVRYDEVGP